MKLPLQLYFLLLHLYHYSTSKIYVTNQYYIENQINRILHAFCLNISDLLIDNSWENWSHYIKASNIDRGDAFAKSVAISSDYTPAVGTDGEASDATGIDGNQDNNNAIDCGAV